MWLWYRASREAHHGVPFSATAKGPGDPAMAMGMSGKFGNFRAMFDDQTQCKQLMFHTTWTIVVGVISSWIVSLIRSCTSLLPNRLAFGFPIGWL